MPDETPLPPPADHLDRQIAALLACDARVSFRRIAADLGVTEGTVRGRVKRLQSAGLLKLTPIVDIGRAGHDGDRPQHLLFVTVTCVNGKLDEIRGRLLDLPLVQALYDALFAPAQLLGHGGKGSIDERKAAVQVVDQTGIVRGEHGVLRLACGRNALPSVWCAQQSAWHRSA